MCSLARDGEIYIPEGSGPWSAKLGPHAELIGVSTKSVAAYVSWKNEEKPFDIYCCMYVTTVLYKVMKSIERPR